MVVVADLMRELAECVHDLLSLISLPLPEHSEESGNCLRLLSPRGTPPTSQSPPARPAFRLKPCICSLSSLRSRCDPKLPEPIASVHSIGACHMLAFTWWTCIGQLSATLVCVSLLLNLLVCPARTRIAWAGAVVVVALRNPGTSHSRKERARKFIGTAWGQFPWKRQKRSCRLSYYPRTQLMWCALSRAITGPDSRRSSLS
jgi:hypothetical protein